MVVEHDAGDTGDVGVVAKLVPPPRTMSDGLLILTQALR
jgi:hypothetical protein